VTRVWLITGTSRGFGRVWAQAALERGDSVAATARDIGTLEDLAADHGERLLARELAEFGVHVTLVEPGGFTTDWSGDSAGRARQMAVYDGVRERRLQALGPIRSQPGDPQATGAAILELVDAADRPCGCSSAAPACRSPGVSTPRGARPGRSGTAWRNERRVARSRAEQLDERCQASD